MARLCNDPALPWFRSAAYKLALPRGLQVRILEPRRVPSPMRNRADLCRDAYVQVFVSLGALRASVREERYFASPEQGHVTRRNVAAHLSDLQVDNYFAENEFKTLLKTGDNALRVHVEQYAFDVSLAANDVFRAFQVFGRVEVALQGALLAHYRPYAFDAMLQYVLDYIQPPLMSLVSGERAGAREEGEPLPLFYFGQLRISPFALDVQVGRV